MVTMVPIRMTGPLVILALLCIIAGWHFVADWRHGPLPRARLHQLHQGTGGTLVSDSRHARVPRRHGRGMDALRRPGSRIRSPLHRFKNKFYFDELYAALIAGTQDVLASIAAFLDKWVIDGVLVRGLSGAAWGTRLCAAVPPVRQPPGLRLPLRRRRRGADLFHGLRLRMLNLLIIIPLGRSDCHLLRCAAARSALIAAALQTILTLFGWFGYDKAGPHFNSGLPRRSLANGI